MFNTVKTVGIVALTAAMAGSVGCSSDSAGAAQLQIVGSDLNSVANSFVQPTDPASAGGGRDQTLQFGDILRGTTDEDLLLGGLGIDILFGEAGPDILVGGSEHFNPNNRDRAFGGSGADVFIWSPGDGSDFFDGGSGDDAVVFGLLGEVQEDGNVEFKVSNDQLAGAVFIDPTTDAPMVDVTNSPGFCPIIDGSSSADAQSELDALGLDHLVQFVIRGIRNAFEAGEQSDDNGLRVTLHLTDVEVLVCTSRNGGEIEIFDLTTSPATKIGIDAIANDTLRAQLERLVF